MRTRFIFLAALAGLVPAAAAAQFDVGAEGADPYAACIARTRTEPVEAYEDALAWGTLGGGVQAQHCAAIALVALGHEEEAATRLEALSDAPALLPAKAELLRQAASSWLVAGELERAHRAIGRALEVNPNQPDLHLLRAKIALDGKDFEGAIPDLDKAVGGMPGNPEPLILRAHAKLYDGALDDALADAEAAVEADPRNVEARLILGDIREAIRTSGR